MALHPFRIPLILLLLTLCLAFPAARLQADGQGGAGDLEPVRLVVGLRNPGAAPALAAMFSAANLTPQDAAFDFMIVETTAALAQQVAQQLRAQPQVRYVEQDGRVSAAFTPNDPAYNDPSKVYGPQQIGASTAWDSTTGANVTIAILDTGIDHTHPEFAGRITAGWDFAQQDGDPSDDHGHGTHVAGIAGAAIHNGVGIAGMAGAAQIMPVKVLNASATGWWSDVAAGIRWAADHGAQVINLSLSGSIGSQALSDAIEYAHGLGVLVVAAAGNESADSPRYPASLNHVLSAGATTASRQRWTLSNFGANLDVMAPGATVYSTAWQEATPAGYRFMNGTSMAAPHVAGLAALLFSLDETLTPDAITEIIISTSQDMDAPGYDAYTGAGLVDAAAAAAAVLALLPPPPDPPCITRFEGLVYRDFNGNGVRDAGEPGWAGLPAALVAADSRQAVALTETDAAGLYRFEDVAPAAYLIDINQQAAWLAGNGLTTGNEPQPAQAAPCSAITLPAIGFGPQAGSSGNLGGRIYTNASAAQVGTYQQVTLHNRTHTYLLGSVESDAFGLYRFDQLAAGIYIVETTTTAATAAAASLRPSAGATVRAVRLGQNESNFSVDLNATSAGAIGGALYLDSNGNGRLDAAEMQAVSSGVVTLTNLSTLETMITVSDSAGNYLFAEAPDGAYRLTLDRTLPGLVLTSANNLEVTIAAGEVYVNADFGYIAPAAVALSDFTAQPTGQGILIAWSTSSEDEHSSFRIWRAATPGGKYKPVSEVILAFGYRTGASYKWLDKGVGSDGAPVYQLQSLPDGAFYGPITPSNGEAGAFVSTVFIPFVQR